MKPAIERFKVPIQFPNLSGPHFLLHWWTPDMRDELSFARTEKALVQTYKALVNSGRHHQHWAEPRGYYELDIVAPTDEMKLKHAQSKEEFDMDMFSAWMSGQLRLLGEDLPEGFTKCVNYKQSSGPEDPWYREAHMDCANCNNKYTYDLKSQYVHFYEEYQASNYYRPENESHPICTAKPAKKNRAIYAVRLGMEDPLLKVTAKDFYLGQESVAFFCHAKKLDLPQVFVDLHQESIRNHKEEERQWRAEAEQKQREESKRAAQKAKDLFKK